MSRQDSRKIENVKVMLVKGATGEDGSSIESIEKTGTSGVVDTYTITLTDGSKSTFTVTNGSSIASIEKTGTSGLVDTYTVTLTDGSTTTFTVTNGKSISSIEKTGTSGLVDTYTITYNDGTTSTFTVTNGRNGEDATTQSLAYVNDGNTAGKDFKRGELLVLEGLLYQTTVAISSGTTLEVGTNIARTKVSDLVNIFGVCDSAGSSGSKEVTLTNAPNDFRLYDGLKVRVKFTNANTYSGSTITLNVNGTGGKSIYVKTGSASFSYIKFNWCDGEIVEFIFDMNSYNSDGEWRMIPTQRMLQQIADSISPFEKNWNAASKAYAVGDYVRFMGSIVGSPLERVTSAVAQGESLAGKTEQTTVGEELKRRAKIKVLYLDPTGSAAYTPDGDSWAFIVTAMNWNANAQVDLVKGYATSSRSSVIHLATPTTAQYTIQTDASSKTYTFVNASGQAFGISIIELT